MPIGAIIGGVASVGGALIGSNAASKASKAQIAAGQQGIGEIQRQFDTTRGDYAPWREAGSQAIGSLSDMLQPGYDYTTSPGYQFRFNEGQRAVEGSAAAKGMLMSGGTLKDLARFGQGIAADDFNQQFSRTATVAGAGQGAVGATAAAGANASNNIANLYNQQGQARASGYMNQAGALNNGLSNLAWLGMNGGFGGGFNPYSKGYEFGPNG